MKMNLQNFIVNLHPGALINGEELITKVILEIITSNFLKISILSNKNLLFSFVIREEELEQIDGKKLESIESELAGVTIIEAWNYTQKFSKLHQFVKFYQPIGNAEIAEVSNVIDEQRRKYLLFFDTEFEIRVKIRNRLSNRCTDCDSGLQLFDEHCCDPTRLMTLIEATIAETTRIIKLDEAAYYLLFEHEASIVLLYLTFGGIMFSRAGENLFDSNPLNRIILFDHFRIKEGVEQALEELKYLGYSLEDIIRHDFVCTTCLKRKETIQRKSISFPVKTINYRECEGHKVNNQRELLKQVSSEYSKSIWEQLVDALHPL